MQRASSVDEVPMAQHAWSAYATDTVERGAAPSDTRGGHEGRRFAFEPRQPGRARQPAREIAERLSLPPGVHGQTISREVVPRSSAEARVLHTCLSRSLGRGYRERWGLVLRTDRSGIELAQAFLRAFMSGRPIDNLDDARVLYAHGAFVSEVFARTFGAGWSDLTPRELRHWRMTAGGGVSVCPFGLVVTFVVRRGASDLLSCYDTLRDAR